jgi:hypothetical protein
LGNSAEKEEANSCMTILCRHVASASMYDYLFLSVLGITLTSEETYQRWCRTIVHGVPQALHERLNNLERTRLPEMDSRIQHAIEAPLSQVTTITSSPH